MRYTVRGEGAKNAMRDSAGLGLNLSEAVQLRTLLVNALRAYEAAIYDSASSAVRPIE